MSGFAIRPAVTGRTLNMRKKQRGLAAVEFLISVPLLMIILAGITEFGTALIRYNTLNQMASDGARYAVSEIYGTASSDQIADPTAIKNMVLYGDPDGGTTPLIANLTADNIQIVKENKYVTITITYPYEPVLSTLLADLNLDFNLTTSAIMRTAL